MISRQIAVFTVAILAILPFAFSSPAGGTSRESFPEFEFYVWVSPPSRRVYAPSREPAVQHILFSIEEESLSVEKIAARASTPEEQVLEKLRELGVLGLVRQEGLRWISNTPMYTKNPIYSSSTRTVGAFLEIHPGMGYGIPGLLRQPSTS